MRSLLDVLRTGRDESVVRGNVIPDEVAFDGFNSSEARRYSTPFIKTVISPEYAIGEAAGLQWLLRFTRGHCSETEIVLPVYLNNGKAA